MFSLPWMQQVLALLHALHDGLALVAGEELVDPHGAGIVGHVEGDHPGAPLFQLPVVHGEHVALHNDGAHVQVQAPHGRGLVLDLPAAVDELSPSLCCRPFCPPGGPPSALQGLPADLLGAAEGGGRLRPRGGLRAGCSGRGLGLLGGAGMGAAAPRTAAPQAARSGGTAVPAPPAPPGRRRPGCAPAAAQVLRRQGGALHLG